MKPYLLLFLVSLLGLIATPSDAKVKKVYIDRSQVNLSDEICKTELISVTGRARPKVFGTAYGNTKDAWEASAKSKFGEKFMDLNNARKVKDGCWKTGKILERCEVQAYPCAQKLERAER